MRIETTILSNLIYNEDYAKSVLPFIKSEYFNDTGEARVFEEIQAFTNRYHALPTKESLLIELSGMNILEDDLKKAKEIIGGLQKSEQVNIKWLTETTEKFCQTQALQNALMESVEIFDGKSKKQRGEIPEILKSALSVGFDPNIGHSFFDDFEKRYDFYHAKKHKLPFDIDILNRITGGGVEQKTLNLIIAGIGVGKTFTLCHLAGAYLMQGKNVLYITLEMAEEKIAERIEANLMGVTLEDLQMMHHKSYTNRIKGINARTPGNLFIKEFPTVGANVNHFRFLLNELELKKGFVPDVILIDYINICASVRSKNSSDLYQHVKAIAEELRGLAIERKLPIWSAAQFNRNGIGSSDPTMTDTAESMGLPATLDFMLALVQSETFAQKGLIFAKQLKNRYGDVNKNTKFVIGMDRSRFRLHDAPDDEQEAILIDPTDTPVMDNTPSGQAMSDSFSFDLDED